ncbi:MAG: MATE family efflux transporter [Bacillus sp. (in: Bacteria)]|nr:MATE family efflux transporter [Bacillus sp. (in: firmicutes)]MCM1425175.1 MATE family efflux transporter [Eubacterium sp.]
MNNLDMTKGEAGKHLLQYALPLILGNFFQLTYNVVDSVILGRFVGKEALAASGMANPVINLMILGISGVCLGAGVMMSEFFGAGKWEMLKKEVATISIFGCGIAVFIALLGIVFTVPLLRALSVPNELVSMTDPYLKIIFTGVPFVFFYNALSMALKSTGDSKATLKFLVFSSLLNAALDLIFIGGLGYGIICSSITTVISEAASVLLSLVYIYRKADYLCPARQDIRVDRALLTKTLQYGGITALQQLCQPLGKLLIQGSVNKLGIDAIAAYNIVTRIDDFAYTPQQSIAHGITTFVAQNRGAGKVERVREGFKKGLYLEVLYWILLCMMVFLGNRVIISLFIDVETEQNIMLIGSRYLATMAFFYLFPAFTNGIQGFFRGMGDMKITLISTYIQASLRVVFTAILTPHMGIYGICFAAAIGWICMLLYEVPCYFRRKK